MPKSKRIAKSGKPKSLPSEDKKLVVRVSSNKPESQPAKKIEIAGNVEGANIIIGDGNAIGQAVAIPATKESKTKTQSGSLPSGSNIPFPRDALFTGREADLDKIADSLLGDNPSTTLISQAITGMGGIGKTQLAVEFAYRHGHQFDGVHWLNLASPESLDSEIAACGRAMGLTFDDQREQVANTLNIWQSGGLRLLILDNFESIENANKILVGLQGANMRLLITSRRNDWSKELGLHPLPLNLFSEDESLEFLERSLEKKEGKEERKSLADKLGDLPLALELAAKYINVNKISITKYLGELNEILSHESMGTDWFKDLDIKTPTEHELSLFATFQLSWKEVKEETQQNVFRIAGYCASNTPIPLEIFIKTLEINDKQINKAIYRLNALGLLSADGLPSIHPLLAAFARNVSEGNEILEKLSNKLAKICYDLNNAGLPLKLLPFRPHLQSVLENIQPDELQEIKATLWTNLGFHQNATADYQGAINSYKNAITISEKVLGAEHELTALRVSGLAGVFYALGNLNGAKINFERALKIDEAAFGSDHPNVANDVNNLGMVLKDLGDLNGAKANYERALKIDEAAFGQDHPNVAIRVNNLGDVLQDLGDLNGAKANYERALKIDEAAFGPDHPNVAIRVNNLGEVLQDLGDLDGAKINLERALKIFEKQLGESHPNVTVLVNNLGMVLQDLGDLNGAKANYERALKIDEAVLGPDHPNVAIDVNNLGSVLQDLGDLNGAKANYERALKIDEAAFGPNHPNVAIRINNLGSVLQDLGDLNGAKINYERALKIFKQFLPEGHPNIKTVEENLKALEK